LGTSFQFLCPSCGYAAEACSGRQRGFEAVLRTMVCKDCMAVVDVLIGRFGIDGPTGDAAYDARPDRCPDCKGTNLRRWVARRCPKCRATMARGDRTWLWD
jgi:hypothetical protein